MEFQEGMCEVKHGSIYGVIAALVLLDYLIFLSCFVFITWEKKEKKEICVLKEKTWARKVVILKWRDNVHYSGFFWEKNFIYFIS